MTTRAGNVEAEARLDGNQRRRAGMPVPEDINLAPDVARKLELLGLRPNEFRQPTLVRAPISGKILEINVTPGEYRGAVASHSDTTTAPLMTIADLSTVWLSSDVG